jgi:DNA-binding transcriptional regulator YdaS (Cro superfamily)
MSLDHDQKLFVALGQRLCGDDWNGKFARMIGLSRPYVSMIARGDRPVTQTVAVAVIEGLRAEVKRLNAQAAIVAALADKYEAAVLTRLLPGK